MLIVAAAAVKPSLTSKQIKCELDLSASTKTVRRRLHDVRLRNCVPASKGEAKAGSGRSWAPSAE
ncbi:hypothetical protein HPB48_015249 [Haemaphysalis longicornis]|uniref:Transposase Tc1-like domain-containing protein n=1 Tax=Haemaphysalis longicornis TaxID=44386 RepID=A0A9J6FL93_HAELO|nr:hypothetical protein HPB48_015249 [Haemaphysalis longicornis]